jgi:hypothetical protein
MGTTVSEESCIKNLYENQPHTIFSVLSCVIFLWSDDRDVCSCMGTTLLKLRRNCVNGYCRLCFRLRAALLYLGFHWLALYVSVYMAIFRCVGYFISICLKDSASLLFLVRCFFFTWSHSACFPFVFCSCVVFLRHSCCFLASICFGLHGHLQVCRIFHFHMLEGFCFAAFLFTWSHSVCFPFVFCSCVVFLRYSCCFLACVFVCLIYLCCLSVQCSRMLKYSITELCAEKGPNCK